jgi:hypothetical protein
MSFSFYAPSASIVIKLCTQNRINYSCLEISISIRNAMGERKVRGARRTRDSWRIFRRRERSELQRAGKRGEVLICKIIQQHEKLFAMLFEWSWRRSQSGEWMELDLFRLSAGNSIRHFARFTRRARSTRETLLEITVVSLNCRGINCRA